MIHSLIQFFLFKAPVQEIEPLACQSLINKEDSEVYKALSKLVPSWNPQVDEGILVFLCQPYYITDLRCVPLSPMSSTTPSELCLRCFKKRAD